MLKLDCYANYSDEDVYNDIVSNYDVKKEDVDKFEILIALLDGEGYEGYSFFLLKDKETGQLFENSASHCSCHGFEEQWEPKPTSMEYLMSEHFHAYGVSKEVIKNFFE